MRQVSPHLLPGALPCPWLGVPISPDLPAPLHPRMATLHSGRGLWGGFSLLTRGLPNIEDILGPAGESRGRGAPAAVSDGDLLTAPAWGREGLSSTRVRLGDPLSSIRILKRAWLASSSHILIPQWSSIHPKRGTPQPSAHPSHPRKRRETQPPTLEPTAGGDAELSVSSGPGQQRPLHGRGCDE